MKRLLTKSQEFFLPQYLWKDTPGKVQESIIAIKNERESLSKETGKALNEHMGQIEDERLADEKLAATKAIQEYLEIAGQLKKSQREKQADVKQTFIAAAGDNLEIAKNLATDVGARSLFIEGGYADADAKHLESSDFTGGGKDLFLKEQEYEQIVSNIRETAPEEVDDPEADPNTPNDGTDDVETLTDDILNYGEGDPDQTPAEDDLEENILTVSSEERTTVKASLEEMVTSANTLQEEVKALYDTSDEATKAIISKNLASFQESLQDIKNLGAHSEDGIMTNEQFLDFGQKAENITASIKGLEATDFAKEDFKDPLPDYITNFTDILARLDKQNKKSASSMEMLLNGMPNIREVFATQDITEVQTAYENAIAEEMNAWAKKRRQLILKNPKKADKRTEEMSPFLQAFFRNMPNGALLKSQLMQLTDNPPGGLEAVDYFDELGFSENVDDFFKNKADQLPAILEDPDYRVLDDSNPEDAKFLYEAALEAKAEGATKNMRELYIMHIKKNAYIPFMAWMKLPAQKKKFGTIAKLSMMFNKFLDGFGDILKMFGINVSLNGLSDYETSLKNTSEGKSKNGEDVPLDDGLSDKYKERPIEVNLENFKDLSEAEKTDLWETRIKGEEDPEKKKQFISKYYEQYAANTDGSKDLVQNLQTAKTSFGNAVDFLDLEDADTICSPSEFQEFQEKSKESPYKEFLVFGQKHGDGASKISFDLWQEFASMCDSFDPALKVDSGTEKITFTAEGSPEKAELFSEEFNEEKIRELINEKLPKLQKEDELPFEEQPQEKKGFWSSVGSTIKKNPGKTGGAVTGATIGAFVGGPVGALIGGGIGFVGGWAYDTFFGGSGKQAMAKAPSSAMPPMEAPTEVTEEIPELPS